MVASSEYFTTEGRKRSNNSLPFQFNITMAIFTSAK
jgi:hypothetical protein